MTKVTLGVTDFKVLASETRLEILKALDGKKKNLKDISNVTNLHEMTLHEHLEKLVESGFVKRHEREGHKWVYYSLSWKGASLIHPENTKVVILFSTTIIALTGGIIGLVTIMQTIFTPVEITRGPKPNEIILNPIVIGITLGCFILFVISLVVLIRKSKNNKGKKL